MNGFGFRALSMSPSAALNREIDVYRTCQTRKSTGCPTKNYTLFLRAVAPLNFVLGIKVGGVLESSGSQLFKTVPTFDFWPS